MRRFLGFVIILTVLMISVFPIWGQTGDLIDRMEARRAELTSVRVEGIVEIPRPRTLSGEERSARFPLTFLYRAPGLYKSEIVMGIEGTTLTVCDGTAITSYNTRQESAYRQSVQDAREDLARLGPYDPAQVLLLPEIPLRRIFQITHEGREAGGLERFRLLPIIPVGNYTEIKMDVNPSTLVPVFFTVMNGDELVSTVRITSFEEDVFLFESEFIFHSPDGIEVIEF